MPSGLEYIKKQRVVLKWPIEVKRTKADQRTKWWNLKEEENCDFQRRVETESGWQRCTSMTGQL